MCEIQEAEYHHDIGGSHVFGKKEILHFEMSPSQFADMITGLNVGAGSPITITFREGHGLINPPPDPDKISEFKRDYAEMAQGMVERVDKCVKMAEASHAPKKLVQEIEWLKSHFKSNIPFLEDQFKRQMDRTISEAKAEVDSFITHSLTTYGLEAFRDQMPQLKSGGENEAHSQV